MPFSDYAGGAEFLALKVTPQENLSVLFWDLCSLMETVISLFESDK